MPLYNKNYLDISGTPSVTEETTFEVLVTEDNNQDETWKYRSKGVSDDDWSNFTESDPGYVAVREFRVPYVVFENEDDVTTSAGDALTLRLEKAMTRLFKLWQKRPQIPPAS